MYVNVHTYIDVKIKEKQDATEVLRTVHEVPKK